MRIALYSLFVCLMLSSVAESAILYRRYGKHFERHTVRSRCSIVNGVRVCR